MIEEYEAELARFKSHYEEMMERQEKIFALGPIDPERHLFLKENAEIVLVGLDWHCDGKHQFQSMEKPKKHLSETCYQSFFFNLDRADYEDGEMCFLRS